MKTFILKPILIIVILLTAAAAPLLHPTAEAQNPPDGWSTYALNLRAGPGTSYSVFTTLPANTPVYAEGRNEDLTWLLIHTDNESQRGWVASLYLSYQPGFFAGRLPVSTEVLSPPATTAPASDAPPIAAGSGSGAGLASVPVVPAIGAQARAIFANSGNDPYTLIKVGDCNSEAWEFLGPIATGNYNLGPYAYLQPTVDHFRGSMGVANMTAHGGFTIYAVLDPAWTYDPHCQANETPLACELRIRRPAVAVMMFGPNDVFHLTAAQFESALRQVVDQTIANGTIPVLTTFTWCRTDEFQEKGLHFNTITVNVGQEYGIPVINFWRAAQDLPNCGLRDDTHLSVPVITTTGDFNGEETRTGYTLRNLLTLQTLDAIRVTALQ